MAEAIRSPIKLSSELCDASYSREGRSWRKQSAKSIIGEENDCDKRRQKNQCNSCAVVVPFWSSEKHCWRTKWEKFRLDEWKEYRLKTINVLKLTFRQLGKTYAPIIPCLCWHVVLIVRLQGIVFDFRRNMLRKANRSPSMWNSLPYDLLVNFSLVKKNHPKLFFWIRRMHFWENCRRFFIQTAYP